MSPFALVLFGGGVLFGVLGVGRFEREAAGEIRGRLQGDRVEVRVNAHLGIETLDGLLPGVDIHASHFRAEALPLHTEPSRSKRGRVKTVRLDLTDFFLKGLRVESLEATLRDSRFDMGLALSHHHFRLSKSGVGPVEVRLRDKDLEPFILGKFHEIKSVSVTIADGRIDIKGFGQFLVFETHFDVSASLTPANGTQLLFKNAVVTFDGQPAEAESAKVLLDVLNPIVDLDKDLSLEGAVRVESVKLEAGELVVDGQVSIPSVDGKGI